MLNNVHIDGMRVDKCINFHGGKATPYIYNCVCININLLDQNTQLWGGALFSVRWTFLFKIQFVCNKGIFGQ